MSPPVLSRPGFGAALRRGGLGGSGSLFVTTGSASGALFPIASRRSLSLPLRAVICAGVASVKQWPSNITGGAHPAPMPRPLAIAGQTIDCLLYTSDAADE